MPGTTDSGIPYALPSDPLVQWPSTSQALAEKVQTDAAAMTAFVTGRGPVIQSGGLPAAGPGTRVNFVRPFKASPVVVLTPLNASVPCAAQLLAVDATGFTYAIHRLSDATTLADTACGYFAAAYEGIV